MTFGAGLELVTGIQTIHGIEVESRCDLCDGWFVFVQNVLCSNGFNLKQIYCILICALIIGVLGLPLKKIQLSVFSFSNKTYQFI